MARGCPRSPCPTGSASAGGRRACSSWGAPTRRTRSLPPRGPTSRAPTGTAGTRPAATESPQAAPAAECIGAPSGPVRGDLHARVVVASAAGDVGVVRRRERGDGLAVVAGAEPRALERADDTGADRVGDPERQVHLSEVVPHAHARAVGEAAGPRVVGVHLERRCLVAGGQAAER